MAKSRKKRLNKKEKIALNKFKYLLSDLPDPRRPQGVRYPLESVITIALMASMSNADNAQEMQNWGEYNEDWLENFLSLPHGIPSQDVFLSVFAALNPVAFLEVFISWMKLVQVRLNAHNDSHISIDGKAIRRSFDKANDKPMLHKVSAWASEVGMVMGQVSTDAKSNEITAIPELLKIIDIRGCTITIDAMGCQRKIVKDIKDNGGDYLIAVKGNQKKLYEEIKETFVELEDFLEKPAEFDELRRTESGHGRLERRTVQVLKYIEHIECRSKWKGLSFIVKVKSERIDLSKETNSVEYRYYIGSKKSLSTERIMEMIRNHWGIENSLHWVLDMAFREDELRHRAGNCAENFSTLRHFVLNLIKNYPKRKHGIRNLRKNIGWNPDVLIDVLLSWRH